MEGGWSIQYSIQIDLHPQGRAFPLFLYGLEVEVLPLSRIEVIFPSVEFVFFMEVVREKNQNKGCRCRQKMQRILSWPANLCLLEYFLINALDQIWPFGQVKGDCYQTELTALDTQQILCGGRSQSLCVLLSVRSNHVSVFSSAVCGVFWAPGAICEQQWL